MLQEVLSHYNLAPDQLEIEAINNGLINETWLIKNCNSNYILQKVNQNIFKNTAAIAQNVRMIADYLQLHHPEYLFVSPIKTKDNEEMKFIDGKGYFRLMPFVNNSKSIDTVENAEQAFEASRKFGGFTRILSNFPIEKLQITLPDFHNLSLRYDQFLSALKTASAERLQQSEKLITYIKENENIVEVYKHILKDPSFKFRVTHHDTKISNVLFSENDKGICVIDLDTVMPGYFISDVGDMMRTYLSPVNEEEKDFSKIEIREEYFKAMWDGYMSEMANKLSTEEKAHFIYSGKFMIYMQAIRFLTDHLNNDVYYGAKYEGHNFVRASNQVVLLQKLVEKEAYLQNLIS